MYECVAVADSGDVCHPVQPYLHHRQRSVLGTKQLRAYPLVRPRLHLRRRLSARHVHSCPRRYISTTVLTKRHIYIY